MKQRVFSMLLAIMLVFTSVDITAFAQPTIGRTVEDIVELVGTTEEVEKSETTEVAQSSENDEESAEAPSTEGAALSEAESTNAVEESAEESTEEVSVVETETEEETTGVAVSTEENEPVTMESVLRKETLAAATEDGGSVTRIEWLQALVEAFDMTVESDNYPDNYYSDIDSTYEYYHDVMVATEFGLVDVEAGDALEPDALATREFVAHTMNLCMGYLPEEDVTYTFDEVEEVTYPDDIQIAINKGWFVLEEGNFLPEQGITISEKDAMITIAKDSLSDAVIATDYDNQYSAKEGVIVLPETVKPLMTGDNELTLYECTTELKNGDIFIAFSEGIPIAYKVASVVTTEESVVVTTEDVELEDAFGSIDLQGTVEADMSKVEVINEEAEITYVVGGSEAQNYEDGIEYTELDSVGNQKVNAVFVDIAMDIPENVIEEHNLNDGLKAEIKCTISNVQGDTKYEPGEGAYLGVSGTVKFTSNVSLDVLDALGVNKKLAEVPIAGIGRFKVTLDAALKGEVSVNLVENFSLGVYASISDGFRMVQDFKKKSFTIQASVEGKLGVKVSAGVDVVFIKGELYAKIGAKASLESVTYEEGTPTNCTHMTAHLYASAGASVTAKIGIDAKILFWDVKATFWEKTWEKEYVLWNAKNSPVRVAHHYEEGKPVSRCTREETEEDGSEGESSPKRWKYYTPADSQYGYSGASSGIGSDGEPFTIFDYSLDEDDNATITGYHGNVSALNIPETLDGYTVTGIGNNVFKGNTQLHMVVIPDSVTWIGSNAFNSCVNLNNLVFSENLVRIDDKAFAYCESLISVDIPDSVTRIGAGTFAQCTELAEVELPDSLLEICAHAFFNCDKLASIEIPKKLQVTYDAYMYEFAYDYQYGPFYGCDGLKNITFQEGITSIPVGLFANCSGIEMIELPNTVTSIGDRAFYNCVNLKNIIIPDVVIYIGKSAFNACSSLTDVKLPKSLEYLGFLAFGSCNSLYSIEIPKKLSSVGIESIWLGGGPNYRDGGPFTYCSNLKEVTFEEGTDKVVANLFTWCAGLETVNIPSTVTRINTAAFKNCYNLKTVNIPNSVTRISEYAFAYCIALESINLPKNLIYIGDATFVECDKLNNIVIPKTLKDVTSSDYSYDAGPFGGCDGLNNLSFEEGITFIPSYLLMRCYGLENITIPEGVTEIEYNVFESCVNLNEVILPTSLKIINREAFNNCSSLTEINIPDNVEKIEYSAFESCTSLNQFTFPDKVTTVNSYVFKNCTNLEKVFLSVNIVSIDYQAFIGCSKLTEIEIPQKVKSIGQYAFYGTGLKEIALNGNVQSIGEYAFYDCASLSKVILGDNVKSIGDCAFRYCNALVEVSMPNTVTSMGTHIFANCEVLSKVSLGTGVSAIPSYMFYQCPALEKITLPYCITTIQAGAFANCVNLKEIYIPRKTSSIATDAFSYPTNMTVYGVSGTYAETWTTEVGATFVNQEVNATAVELNTKELTINNGKKATLAMTVAPANFTDEVVWRSSDESVVTVSDTGVVSAEEVGTATIRVSVGDVSASCKVTVVQPVTSISLNKTSLSLDGGGTYQLTATVNPSTANNKEISWSSSDESIATVSETGLVTALKKGSAVITVSALDGSGVTNTCDVTVKNMAYIVDSVEDMQSSHPYENSSTDSWIYTLTGAGALEVTFSEDTEVEEDFDFIYVYDGEGNQIGKYTGKALAGETISVNGDTVRVQLVSDDATNAYGFAITEIRAKGSTVELTGISLDKDNLTLYMGDTVQLTVIYEPENAVVESEAEWTSDNTDVATVEKGMITAVGVGTATITATVDGKQASCIVTVNPETVEIEDIVLTPAEVDLYVGQTKTITVSILPEGLQPNESIQWLDYDENTISVKAKNSESLAEVKGLKAGTTQIKVRVDGIEKTVAVTVLPCTIRLDYRDGSEIRSIDAVYGEPISNLPSNPEREGYIFAGWYTKENGEGELVTADTILIDQWILYAHWISVNDGMWATPIGDQVYTGKAIKPSVEVYDGDTLLVLGQDYTVSYKNNTNVADKYAAKAPTVIVKGKGQYQSSATVTFNIVPKSIEDMDVTAESVYKIVSSKVQKPTPVVKWANKSLKKGKDFTVSYPETQSGAYKEPGRYEIVIKGTGNYTGERSVWLVLSEKERTPISKASVKKIADVQWEGYEICPKPVVTYKKATLEEGIDYELEYENNIEVGTATIKMIGIGSYSGMKKVTFKIKGVSISKASVNGLGPVTYNGEDQEPLTTLWIDGEELYEYNDYTVTYKNNRNVGTAQVIFTGKGKYTGTLKKTFKINQYDFSAHSLDYIDSECFYSKGGSKPIVSLWVNGEKLAEGKDYKISYKNNKAVNDGSNSDKQPTVILKGMGNFKGTITETFVIEAKYIDDVSINVQDVVTPTKKNKWKSIPVLTDTDGKKLVAGKDYDKNIVYTYAEEAIMQDGSIREAGTEVDKNDIPSVGTSIDVTINGINNYHGVAIVTYMVVPASIAQAKTSVPNQIYTSQEITLEESDITVKVGGQKLSTDDFEIVPNSYVNNVKKGTASVTIRGTGNYGGTKVVKFKIVPKSIIWWK